MAQVTLNVEAFELNAFPIDSSELVFLEDSSYEHVGGGDAVNGY